MLGDITAGPAFRFTQWLQLVRKRTAKYPSSDLIGLAVSKNGVHWERGGGPARPTPSPVRLSASTRD